MNGQEQKERQTAVARLERIIERMDRDFSSLLKDEKDLLSAEIEARVEADGIALNCMRDYTHIVDMERADSQMRMEKRLDDRLLTLERLSIRDVWSRLRWLFTGRLD